MAGGFLEERRKSKIRNFVASDTYKGYEKLVNFIHKNKLDINDPEVLDLYYQCIIKRYPNNTLNKIQINSILMDGIITLEQLLANDTISNMIVNSIVEVFNEFINNRDRIIVNIDSKVFELLISNEDMKNKIMDRVDIQSFGEKYLKREMFFLNLQSFEFKLIQMIGKLGFEAFKSEKDFEQILGEYKLKFQDKLSELGLIDNKVVSRMYQYQFEKLKEWAKNPNIFKDVVSNLTISTKLVPSSDDKMANYWREQSILLGTDALAFVCEDLRNYLFENSYVEDVFGEIDDQEYIKSRRAMYYDVTDDAILKERFFTPEGMLTDSFFDDKKYDSFMYCATNSFYENHGYNYSYNKLRFLSNNLDRLSDKNLGFIKTWKQLGEVKDDDKNLGVERQEQFLRFVTSGHRWFDHQFFDENGVTDSFFKNALYSLHGIKTLQCFENFDEYYTKSELQYIKLVFEKPYIFEVIHRLGNKNSVEDRIGIYFDENGLKSQFYHDLLLSNHDRKYLLEFDNYEQHFTVSELNYMKIIMKVPKLEEFLINIGCNNIESINTYFDENGLKANLTNLLYKEYHWDELVNLIKIYENLPLELNEKEMLSLDIYEKIYDIELKNLFVDVIRKKF